MMKTRSEMELIRGIRAHDSAVFEYVYQTCYPVIENFVVHNHGTVEQAEDVFQEGLIIAYRKIMEGNLELTCKFGTYLYAICKKVWIQERKKELLHIEKLRQQPMMVNDPGAEEDPLLQNHLMELFNKHFSELSFDCQRILTLFFTNHSVEEIRDNLNYKDLHHAADRKYRCKKSLIKRIINDPLFKRLKNESR
jgi:RNA polymerase sigma factor (sigma-70 family)